MLDARLVEAFSEVFGVPANLIAADSDRDSLSEWDSVGHLRLILLIEESFKVRFPVSDIPKLTSAGRIQQALNRLLKL